mgnify:CR=1 FL=1|tara:strand:+ start:3533 stop:4255 length:723 start_codon:yes stop_codon:yes gene_type:complete
MKRYEEIDVLKGVAVICMIIFHFFYFPNQYGFKEIEYNTITLKIIAKVAQIIFITCVGINLVFAKKKTNDASYHLKRIGKIACYAILMSLFTYYVFQERYVKFGILHFVAFSSLLLFTFVDNVETMKVITTILALLFVLNKIKPELFRIIPSPLAFISGFYNDRYSAVDHFPILPWGFLICLGVFIGHYLLNNEINTPNYITNNPVSEVLKNIGKRSLEIYAVHWAILYVIYCIIYSKLR